MQNLSGRTIKSYEIREQIGVGGFGAVYRAFQPVIEREVAIKVILPQYANQPDFIRSFESEAQIVARLEHPHIVPLFDYWREPDGAYLVMRWLRGGSVRDMLDERQMLSLEQIGQMLEQITSALHFAHRSGVIHRDLKPDNILLDEETNAYLSDFGIAKAAGHEATSEGITGSLAYISPEQIHGQPPSPQVDTYSLGIVLYEMLTGQHPFPGENAGNLVMHQLNDPLPLLQTVRPELPGELNDVLERATEKDPAARYQDIRELAADYQGVVLGQHALETIEFDVLDTREIVNPYKGLRAFEEADAADFFGRERLVQQLVRRMGGGNRFLAVVGPSGSGKSSVVRAGLIPALRRQAITDASTWFIAEMVPGVEPLQNLVDVLVSVSPHPLPHLDEQLKADKRGLLWAVNTILSDPDSELLLLIDQFEEIFTLLDDEEERVHLLDLLYTAVTADDSRLRLVITLRADFYDKPLLYEGFGTLVQAYTQVVLPLTAEEIEHTITGPAKRVGLQVETELIAAIVADVREEPGALPLLQYALTELYERREGRTLTLKAYQASGGVLGALARRAEELYSAMGQEEQAVTRQVFLRLVTLGEGTEDTRRRVQRKELQSIIPQKEALNSVLDAFGKYRLLTFDIETGSREPLVEVAHEALIREWQRLRQWLAESRDDIRLQQMLAAAVAEWVAHQSSPDFLLQGGRLAQFEEWAQQTDLPLSSQEQNFLTTSITARNQRQQEEQLRREREMLLHQRARNRTRLLVAAVLIGVIGVSLAAFAFVQSQRAEEERQRAETEAQQASSIAQTASAQQVFFISNDTDLAIALALEAISIPNPPLLAQNVLAQVAFAPGTRSVLSQHETPVYSVAFSPDGTQALTGDAQGQLILWDLAAAEPVWVQETAHRGEIRAVAFSPDGQFAVSGGNDGAAFLWEVANGDRADTYRIGLVNSVQFSPDGELLALGILINPDVNTRRGEVVVWDLAADAERSRTVAHSDQINDMAFSPDGSMIATSSNDQSIALVRVEDGSLIRKLNGHVDRVLGIDFSSDGQWLISASFDGSVILWDVRTGEILRRYAFDTNLKDVTWAENEEHFIVGDTTGHVQILDQETGELLVNFFQHTGEIERLAINTETRQLLSASRDTTVRLWDLEDGAQQARLQARSIDHRAAVLSPDGMHAVSGTADGQLIRWDVESGAEQARLNAHLGAITALAYSPDGNAVLSGSQEGTVKVWHGDAGELLLTFNQHSNVVQAIAVSPDGQTVLSGGRDNVVLLWNIATGEVLHRLEGHTGWVWSVAFSPDGTLAASAADDQYVYIWDVATGEVVQRIQHIGIDTPAYAVLFTPDSSGLLVAANLRELTLWDVDSGESVASAPQPAIPGDRSNQLTGMAFHPQGDRLAVGLRSGDILLWSVERNEDGSIRSFGEEPRVLEGQRSFVPYLAFTPGGSELLSHSWDGSLLLWDVASGEVRQRFGDDGGAYASQSLQSIVSIPESDLIVSNERGVGGLVLWDFANGEMQRLEQITYSHGALALSPDGRYALSDTCPEYDGIVCESPEVLLWDMDRNSQTFGEIVHRFRGHNGPVNDIAFSPDGTLAASVSEDSRVIVWDMQSRLSISTILDFNQDQVERVEVPSNVTSVVLHPNNAWVIFGDALGGIKRNEISSRDTLQEYSGHSARVNDLAISQDGQRLVSASDDGTLKLWDLETGALIRTFSGHSQPVLSVTFSPEEESLLSGASDGTVILWDVASGAQLQTFLGHSAPVQSVLFEEDGRTLYSAAQDNTIRQWERISFDELLEWVEANRYVRPLTCDEQLAYYVSSSCDE